MKAQLDPPKLVVLIALLLVVMLILLFVFGQQTGSFAGWLEDTRDMLTGKKCEAPFSGRKCLDSCSGSGDDTVRYVPALPPDGFDCEEGEICCEARPNYS